MILVLVRNHIAPARMTGQFTLTEISASSTKEKDLPALSAAHSIGNRARF